MEKPSDGSWVLPKDFSSVNDILDGKKPVASFVNAAGLVRDVQLPIKSRGTDYKMRMSLIDKSVESNGSELSIHIFADKEDMPTVSLCDVVLVRNAKVQRYNNEFSLIVNRSTSFFVYPAETIPPLPLKALPPLRPCGLNNRKDALPSAAALPSERDRVFAAQLFHAVDKTQFPTQVEFKQKVDRTLNVAIKDSSLNSLVGGYRNSPKFYDLLVNVVYISSRPGGDGFTSYIPLWVTDYTEHPQFHEFPLPDDLTGPDAGAAIQGQPGDAWGYLTKYEHHNSRSHDKNNKKGKGNRPQWPGPFGRRCMQIACFEPHATYIRENVQAGDWVQLRNVRVNMGTNGRYLEGFMSNDDARGNPVRVERIDMAGMELEDMSVWHQKALRRKQKYQQHLAALKKKSKKRKAAAMAADGEGGMEAKTAKNAKQRRQEMRARKANGGGSGGGQQPIKQTITNQSIVSEHTDQAVTPLARVLEPLFFKLQDDKQAVLPFANFNFRARVRVVDFLPERLQDFAVSRKASEFDVLQDMDADGDGDDSGAVSSATSDGDDDDDDEDSDDDKQDGTLSRFAGETVWEWRFALLLEDASDPVAPGGEAPPSAAPRRIWAVVDNAAAQLLTGLDACDLRHDGKSLQTLKAKMFLLWGNLEESKQQARTAAREAKNAAAAKAAAARKAAEAKKAAAAAAEERKRERQRQEELKQRQKEEEARRQQEAKQQQAAQGLRRYPAPPLESDDEGEDEVMAEEEGQEGEGGAEEAERPEQATEEGVDTTKDTEMVDAPAKPPPAPLAVRNLPFVCCLRQYGVQVRSAGAGKKRTPAWKQMFSLFGTQIKGI